MEILKMDNVSLTYQTVEQETKAIENITLSISDGEFIALVGPSGCGKTTILSLVSGLIKPTSGTIMLMGRPIDKPSTMTGYMLQRDMLFEWRTIEKNVLLGPEIQRSTSIEKRQEINELLKKYGLWDFRNHYPTQLSGGMRQRAALIRTLALDPKLLLLDEPFSALDFQTRLSVCNDVHKIIKSEKKTALLVTHDISEAVSIADRIVVLSNRPASVKNTFMIDIDTATPLERRESSSFGRWFDTIWKEVSV
ncbi:MAG: ABC transporter ATP-binding protein [Clostridia bacterium]|nr:ABC transporter ATP-binding protein [Clostridia bacterium]